MRLMIGMVHSGPQFVLREGACKARVQRDRLGPRGIPHGTDVECLVFQQAADFGGADRGQARNVPQKRRRSAISSPAGTGTMRGGRSPAAAATARTKSA